MRKRQVIYIMVPKATFRAFWGIERTISGSRANGISKGNI